MAAAVVVAVMAMMLFFEEKTTLGTGQAGSLFVCLLWSTQRCACTRVEFLCLENSIFSNHGLCVCNAPTTICVGLFVGEDSTAQREGSSHSPRAPKTRAGVASSLACIILMKGAVCSLHTYIH
jgi:hypothetical protein